MDPTRPLPRTLLALLALSAAVTAGAVLLGLALATPPGGGTAVSPRPVAATPREPARDPLTVLHAWDVRRARAWARGDRGALRDLYVPGSVAGRRDVAMLAAWEERGMRVRGMRMQVLAAEVREATADRVRLVVTDRLASAVAVGRGTRVVLPRDAASTRTVLLRRWAGEWRVAEVRGSGQPAR